MKTDYKQKATCRHIICLLLFTVVFLVSCNKMDENGALDGNWQMTEWRSASGDSIVATNESLHLYYTVKLNLLKFQIFSRPSTYVHTYFRHTGDSLIVTQAFSRPFDDVVPFDSLSAYGCPPDGRFHVDHLSHSTMVLSSSMGRMQFRKF